ncbi:unnamed protein product [Paramecium pentaurelia]|uniref:Uncharacterized protein n=1 Tax=Paramecium pentaurelia TaxID=43138 RepID=A0A8S1Y9B5_9CILI|nr:unnamed protein product [Paramecium pentaurelia]
MKLIIYITAQTVIYQFDANSNLLDDWQGKSNFFTCGMFKYFGSNGSNNISRIFLDIDPHSHYRVDVEVLSYKVPKFYIDNALAHQEIQMPPYEDQICGKSLFDSIIIISIFGQHNRRTLWVSICLVY